MERSPLARDPHQGKLAAGHGRDPLGSPFGPRALLT